MPKQISHGGSFTWAFHIATSVPTVPNRSHVGRGSSFIDMLDFRKSYGKLENQNSGPEKLRKMSFWSDVLKVLEFILVQEKFEDQHFHLILMIGERRKNNPRMSKILISEI